MVMIADQTLGSIARQWPRSKAVFDELGLNFRFEGALKLGHAAAAAHLNIDSLARRLEGLLSLPPGADQDWGAAAPTELIAHILARYHTVHREQFPPLIEAARRLELSAPQGSIVFSPILPPLDAQGLAEHLSAMQQALVSHMQKEEMILFPLIERGAGAMAGGPIHVMRLEHDEHALELARLASLTHNLAAPLGAPTPLLDLYADLRTMRDDLLEHIHLENNCLFVDALNG